MKTNRLLALFLTAFIIFSNICVIAEGNIPTETQPDYEISVNVPVTDIYPEDEVYVTFDLNTPVSIYAIETEVIYDTSLLSFSRIECPLSNDESIIEIVDNNTDGRIVYACTRVGKEIKESTELRTLTIVFTAKESGATQVKVEKLKLVKEDMSYQDIILSQNLISVNVLTKPIAKPPKPSFGGGGGGGGGKISVSGGNSTTAQKTEPIVIPDTEPVVEGKKEFSDLTQVDWAREAIENMEQKGIIQGTSENEFSPLRAVTRAEIAKMLVLAFSLDGQVGEELSFKDISNDAWYRSYIEKAYSSGIINGKNNEEFAPENPASREEFATMLARCISVKGFNLTQDKLNVNYIDETEISEFAVGYIDMLYMSGIMSGDDNGTFRPKDNLTRAEAAVGIYRLLSKVLTETSEVADNE